MPAAAGSQNEDNNKYRSSLPYHTIQYPLLSIKIERETPSLFRCRSLIVAIDEHKAKDKKNVILMDQNELMGW